MVGDLMSDFSIFGKMLMIFGGLLILVGAIFVVGTKFINLGRLPGDIFIQRGNFTFAFPIVSGIIISIVLTIILNLFFRR